MSDWHLYLIRCRDGTLYAGISTDVGHRLVVHQAAGTRGSKYLKGRGPLTVVFQRKLGTKKLALRAEFAIKKLSKARKEELIGCPGTFEKLVGKASPAELPSTGPTERTSQ